MKLFLASSIEKTLPLLKPLLTSTDPQTKVAFIANASDNAEGEAWWIDSDREKFKELGYELMEVDLRTISADDFQQIINETDILHIAGGSVFYLVGLINKMGFKEILIDAIKSGSVIYTGTSAGAMIMGPSIAMFAFDEEEKPFLADVPDQKGFGLINFTIMPHSNNSEFAGEFKEVVEKLPINTDPLLFIQDTQAVWVEDDTFRIVSI